MVFATDTNKNEPKEPESTFILNAFTSLELRSFHAWNRSVGIIVEIGVAEGLDSEVL